MKPEKEVRERWAEIKEEILAATPEREQAEALQMIDALRLELPGEVWGDVKRIVLALAAAVSRLEAERDEDAKNFEATCRLWRDAEEALKVARSAVDELTEQVIEAEGRERELAQALADLFDAPWNDTTDSADNERKRRFERARGALAGGGRTPEPVNLDVDQCPTCGAKVGERHSPHSGGLGLSAEPVAEELRRVLPEETRP